MECQKTNDLQIVVNEHIFVGWQMATEILLMAKTWPAVMMPKAAGRRLRPRMETRRGEVAAIHAWTKIIQNV